MNFLIFSGSFPISGSSVYRIMVSEREELSKLKWIESEKSGYDIGIYKAKAIWFDLHYKEWLEYKKKTIYRDNV